MKFLLSIILIHVAAIVLCQDTRHTWIEAQQSLESHPQDSVHLLQAASAAHTLGYLAKAQYYYLRADSLFPDSRNIVLPLATIYETKGRLGKAIRYYTKLYHMDTTQNIYLRKCAQLYTLAGAPHQAYDHYKRAYKNDSLDVLSIKGLTQILIKQRSYDEVLRLGKEAIALDSTYVVMYSTMAQAYYGKKSYTECIENMQHVGRMMDFIPWQHKLMGLAYFKLDSLEKSIFHLESSLDAAEPDHTSLFYLAMAYESLEKEREAIHYMEKSVEAVSNTEYPSYLMQLARMYKNKKEWEKAIRLYRLLERLQPNNSDVLYHLATCSDLYYKDKKIAIRYYRRYLKQPSTKPKYKAYARERQAYLSRLNFMSGE